MKNPPSGTGYRCERLSRTGFFPRAMRGIRRGLVQLSRSAVPAAAVALVAPALALAQGVAVPARVTDRVDLSRLTTLAGNTHRLAQPQFDQGAAPPDLPMNRMLLVLKRSPEQEAALQDLLNQQQINSSANFHKWLTPDQFGQQFGIADSDLQAVTSWLASFGFQSIQVAKGRNLIEFSGTAAQVQTGLHTAIHQYFVNGEYHWANASDPQIPAALAPVIAGVASLHDFHATPTIVRSGQKVAVTQGPNGKPQINLSNGTTTIHALVPADFDTIYNINSSTMTGSGLTIGIVAVSNINVSDVTAFRNLWGLPSNPPTVILNGPDPGDTPGSAGEGEAVLDATWAGAIAPQAAIRLVVSEDTNATAGNDLSEFYIIDNNLADVMTESFSSCESQFGAQLSGFALMYSGLAEQAAAQGITYAVSSGDGGPDSCDDPSSTPNPPTAASVNILAATPFNVAVGGTMFNEGTNSSTYWSANNNLTTGASALSYIPENAWNEACFTLSSTCQIVGLWSSGGGASSTFSKPIWQAGVAGIPTANHRYLPDVAMNAADHDGYLICIDGSCPQKFAIASGTSASVQVFGAVMALVDQKVGGRVGLPNYTLYKLAANQESALTNCNGSGSPALINATDNCIFNDVTVGNTNLPTNPVETGFTAGVGYDQTTGLGSVNVANLINNWSSIQMAGTTTALTLNNGTAVHITHGTSVPVGIVVAPVAPATGTPTGDVSLIANSATDEGADSFTLSSGTVNATFNATNLLPGGTYQVHAHYEGDGTFLGSDSTSIPVTVTPEASKMSLGIVVVNGASCSTPTTVTYGSPYVLTVDVSQVVPTSTPCAPNEQLPTPTGTVTVTDSFNGGATLPLDGGTFQLNAGGYFEDQPIQLPAGPHSISASYGGDNSFNASGPVSSMITVTPAPTTAAVSANPTAVSAGTPVTLTATVSTQSNATANASQEPTRTVLFLVNGSPLGTAVAVTGGVNQTTMFAQATASMTTSTLAAGANVITAQYNGDSNYQASVSQPVTVTVGSAFNVSPGCASSTITISSPGQSGSCLITATGTGGFAGTITLSTALTNMPTGAQDVPSCSLGTPSQNFTAPNTIMLSASSASGNATMTCATTAASGLALRPVRPPTGGWPLAGAAVSLACALLMWVLQKERRWRFVPLAALLVIAGAALVSCGSSGGGGQANPGTTTGAYTFTVTATPSSGTAQTTTVTVNVQ